MLNGRISLTDIDYSECRKSSAYDAAAIQAHLLDDAGIQELFPAKRAHYSVKEIVYSEGAKVDTVIVVRSGMVKLISYLANGRARIVRVHSKGSWLGLGGVLGQPYEHTAIAIEDTDAYLIPVSGLLRIKSDKPYLYCRLIECWFDYLKEADLWIAEFSTVTPLDPLNTSVVDTPSTQ